MAEPCPHLDEGTTAHFHTSFHPVIQSDELGEDRWCYVDEIGPAVDGPSFSHP